MQVDLQLPPALAQVAVPPLLLQPLVENAIHHGLEPKVEGGRVSVRAQQQAGQLVITVADNGLGRAGATASGPSPVLRTRCGWKASGTSGA